MNNLKSSNRNRVRELEQKVFNLNRIYVDQQLQTEAIYADVRGNRQYANYCLVELYRVKPDHEVFTKNPTLVAGIEKQIEAEKKAAEATAKQEAAAPVEDSSKRYNRFRMKPLTFCRRGLPGR